MISNDKMAACKCVWRIFCPQSIKKKKKKRTNEYFTIKFPIKLGISIGISILLKKLEELTKLDPR